MFNQIGLPEVLIVLVIALIVFGPKRLPELGRSLGKGMREFKESISGKGDDDEESAAKPPQIEGAEAPGEPVEGEVVTHHRG
jgi:sec-independent protein translocase protein TatA